MTPSRRRRVLSRVIAAFGFVVFPYCIALGHWTPDRPELDDLRRWRSAPMFWVIFLVPWIVAAEATHVVDVPVAYGAVYAVALAIVALRLRRRRSSAS